MEDMGRTASEGVRARKRREMRDAIERNAVELVLVRGYDNVTVDMICEAASISPRTFFNHAGSKERAVLGIDPPLPDQSLREAYVAGLGGSPLRDALVMMTSVLVDAGAGGYDLMRKRRTILETTPALALSAIAHLESAQQAMVDLIDRRLAAGDPAADGQTGEQERGRRAAMLFSLAVGMLHRLAHDWMERGLPGDAEAAIDEVLRLARGIVSE